LVIYNTTRKEVIENGELRLQKLGILDSDVNENEIDRMA
jgi:hypothetical protein